MKKKLLAILLAALCVIPFSSALTANGEENGETETGFRIMATDPNSGEPVISDTSVTDFGAIPDDGKDDTAAFQEALRKKAGDGGGIVFVPAGVFNFSNSIALPNGVTLRGLWNNPDYDSGAPETVLSVDFDTEKKNFINIAGKSAIHDLKIYYSKQTAPVAKCLGYAIYGADPGMATFNLTLVNAYNGIYLYSSAQYVSNIFGTVLSNGITLETNLEVTELVNVKFNSSYWNEYDGTDIGAIRQLTREAIPVRIGKVDDILVYNLDFDRNDYSRGVELFLNDEVPGIVTNESSRVTYGIIAGLNGAQIEYSSDFPESQKGRLKNIDEYGDATKTYKHTFLKERYPEKKNLFVVTDSGAVGDGITDDTDAVAAAIEAARANGGGIVFFPAGKYVLKDQIIVPSGVELRGEWDSPNLQSPTRLELYYGEDAPDDFVIGLSENSGIHGFFINFPGMVASSDYIQPYAWAVKGLGKNVWMEYVAFRCSYNGVNLYDVDCSGFTLKGLWGTSMNVALKIGGGSKNGRIEYFMNTYGTWWEDGNLDVSLDLYTSFYTTAVVLGNVSNMEAFSVAMFGMAYGVMFEEQDGKGPEDIHFTRLCTDLPKGQCTMNLAAGDNISVLYYSTGILAGKNINLIRARDSFDGKMRIYGYHEFGTAMNRLGDKDIKIYKEPGAASDFEYLDHTFDYEGIEWKFTEYGGDSLTWILVGCGVAVVVIGVVTVLLVIRKKKKVNHE